MGLQAAAAREPRKHGTRRPLLALIFAIDHSTDHHQLPLIVRLPFSRSLPLCIVDRRNNRSISRSRVRFNHKLKADLDAFFISTRLITSHYVSFWACVVRCMRRNYPADAKRSGGGESVGKGKSPGAMLSGLPCGIKIMGDPTPQECGKRGKLPRQERLHRATFVRGSRALGVGWDCILSPNGSPE